MLSGCYQDAMYYGIDGGRAAAGMQAAAANS